MICSGVVVGIFDSAKCRVLTLKDDSAGLVRVVLFGEATDVGEFDRVEVEVARLKAYSGKFGLSVDLVGRSVTVLGRYEYEKTGL